MDILIRQTEEKDVDDIITVEKRAFGEDSVANLTAELLTDKSGEPRISFLAFNNNMGRLGIYYLPKPPLKTLMLIL